MKGFLLWNQTLIHSFKVLWEKIEDISDSDRSKNIDYKNEKSSYMTAKINYK